MQEILYEETSQCADIKNQKVKYNICKTLGVFSFFLAIFWFFFIIFFMYIGGNWLLNLILHLIPLAFFITLGILLFKLKNKFCNDYDYIFVSGSIRISKVIKNSIRQTIYRFNCSDIDKIGPYESDCFKKYVSMPSIKVNFLTSNKTPQEGKAFYYIKVHINGVNTLLVLECTKLFLINVLKFSKMSIRDEELK